MILAFYLIFINLPVFAHDETSWATDYKAFAYTKRALTFSPENSSRRIQGQFEKILIDPQFLKTKLSEFTGAATTVIDGQVVTIRERESIEGRNLARKFLAREFGQLGFALSEHTYNTGKNFIAEKKGREPQVLILSSHLDSVGNAGANDDGIGTIGALAIAQAIANRDFKYTLRFVGFDEEELGLVGARAYVRALQNKDKLLGDIQMEMMATNSRGDGGFHVIDCDRRDSKGLSQKVMDAIAVNRIPLKRIPACTHRSDHSAFWNSNLAAIVLSENFFGGDEDPCYHSSCDIVDDRMNFDYAANITSAVASAVISILSGN